jgi:hypothetical protein
MTTQTTALIFLALSACAPPAGDDTSIFRGGTTHRGGDYRESGFNGIDGYNEPSRLIDNPENDWTKLPLSGRLMNEPWSGSYWPKQKGGIAYRWKVDQSHDYPTLTRDEALNASPREIQSLSPAEKYDLYVGNYDWPLTERAMGESSPTEASWTGYCHGWSSASAQYVEPAPVRMVNPDGIVVPFGSSDIKALLTYLNGEVLRSTHTSHEWRTEISTAGTVCLSNSGADPGCLDTNAGAFHILVSNLVGLRGRSLLMDVDNTYEKWNQPISSYQTSVLTDNIVTYEDSHMVHREIIVSTQVVYTVEIEPTWHAVVGTEGQHNKTATYMYRLQLNRENEIIGGDWVIQHDDGQFITLQQGWEHLSNLDEDQDGQPDLDNDEASNILFSYFKFPDYLWVQEEGEIPSAFEQAVSGYAFLATNRTTRQDLYDYFGALPAIYEQSIR